MQIGTGVRDGYGDPVLFTEAMEVRKHVAAVVPVVEADDTRENGRAAVVHGCYAPEAHPLAADEHHAARCAYQAVNPPSTLNSCPVTYDEAGEARNTSGPFRS